MLGTDWINVMNETSLNSDQKSFVLNIDGGLTKRLSSRQDHLLHR